MKTVDIDKSKVDDWLGESHHHRVILTRKGRPVALVTNVDGLDEEQIELGLSDDFWQMIQERRKQKTIPLAEAKRRLGLGGAPRTSGRKQKGAASLVDAKRRLGMKK